MYHHRNLLAMYVSSRSVNHNINSPFPSDVGALLMVIPMLRLHNSGKFSCGTIFQSQCASWFWQSQCWGCESNEDVISQLSEGSGVARWLFDILWGWMGWFITNYSYLYSWRISSFLVGLFQLLRWHCLLWRYSCASRIRCLFWQSEFLYSEQFGI